ncbi:Scaffold protein Nfu/NifU N terminal [Orobanche hederae]
MRFAYCHYQPRCSQRASLFVLRSNFQVLSAAFLLCLIEERDVFLIPDFGLKPSKHPTAFFCKTLTTSDTGTHGGFSVPWRAAEKLFRHSDYTMQPLTKELVGRVIYTAVGEVFDLPLGLPILVSFVLLPTILSVATQLLGQVDALLPYGTPGQHRRRLCSILNMGLLWQMHTAGTYSLLVSLLRVIYRIRTCRCASPSGIHFKELAGQRRSMFIQTQSTPNPASLMFYPGKQVMDTGSADFPNARPAMSSPLAKSLYGINVDSRSQQGLGSDFVTVTKSDEIPWDLVKPQVFAAITDFYSFGQPATDIGFSCCGFHGHNHPGR